MQTTRILLTATAGFGVMFLQAGQPLLAQTDNEPALTGQVTSVAEGPMEGVLVSAKRTGSTITTTVVTDRQGHYQFPRERLQAGLHTITIWATGYQLDGDVTADMKPQSTATMDLALRTTDDLAAQLSNAEWLHSMSGTPEQKRSVRGCAHCHLLQFPVNSTYDADAWIPVLERMAAYPPLAFPLMPQLRPAERVGPGWPNPEEQAVINRERAEYLASINLSSTPVWDYPLKTFPRPTGKATQVIYTTYDLSPATRQPHDVIVDSDGMVWYASFGEQILAKLDPETGETREYEIPLMKPGAPTGMLGIAFDQAENIWMAAQFQGGILRFSPQTETFDSWRLPEELNGPHTQVTQLSSRNSHVDGKVWMVDAGTYTVLRVDLASGEFEVFEPFEIPRPNIYAVRSDARNNAYFTVYGAGHIGRIDAETGEITLHETPTARSAPRRGWVDAQDRFWFGENFGNGIGMFDPVTEQIKEWKSPTPHSYPYDVTLDKHGYVWAGGEYSDRILRLTPETGEIVEYALPGFVNVRRTFVDNRPERAEFWVGANHTASIIKLEPLDTPISTH